MSIRLGILLLLLSLLPPASVCLAQAGDQEQIWRPPRWVWGSGYAPSDFYGGQWGYGYDPFYYSSHAGKTYRPYSDPFIYYSHPGKTFHPYSYPYYYPDGAWYPQAYWYPYSYNSYYWWYW